MSPYRRLWGPFEKVPTGVPEPDANIWNNAHGLADKHQLEVCDALEAMIAVGFPEGSCTEQDFIYSAHMVMHRAIVEINQTLRIRKTRTRIRSHVLETMWRIQMLTSQTDDDDPSSLESGARERFRMRGVSGAGEVARR